MQSNGKRIGVDDEAKLCMQLSGRLCAELLRASTSTKLSATSPDG
jgi:hypothetical protein